LSGFLKKYDPSLDRFQTGSSAPLLRWQEVGFLVLPFSEKKVKVLKVLVGIADSLAEHTLYGCKVYCDILYMEVVPKFMPV
jgi:hypothetical protein